MNKYLVAVIVTVFGNIAISNAQVGVFIGPGFGYGPMMYGGGYRPHPRRQQNENLPSFKPTLNISLGYGFPNLDKNELPEFTNMYLGTTTSQLGPLNGSIDYRFSRNMSLGIMVTHGTITAPYYNYGSSSTPALTASLNNWSVMLDFIHYIPASEHVTPYIRTAIGVNSWQQNYTDDQGNKVNMDGSPSDLAYQIGLGANFYVTKNYGLFLEAGYGKYILQGGLTFRF
jgi:opacity protein-like surface antigen